MPVLMNLYNLAFFCFKVRDYRPRKVTLFRIWKWVRQYPPEFRPYLIKLLFQVRYISQKDAREILLKLHENLMRDLDALNIPKRNILYVTFSDTASSSHDMLSLLRNDALLEQSGIQLIDAHNITEFNQKVSRIGEGVIIYIDDFIGSGNQFVAERQFIMSNVPLVAAVNKFAEYLITPCVCEEGERTILEQGIEVRSGNKHLISERPLHSGCAKPDSDRTSLIECGEKISGSRYFLGYDNMATMVVIYRNAPTNMSVLFRGNPKQTPLIGIFPRTTDLRPSM